MQIKTLKFKKKILKFYLTLMIRKKFRKIISKPRRDTGERDLMYPDDNKKTLLKGNEALV